MTETALAPAPTTDHHAVCPTCRCAEIAALNAAPSWQTQLVAMARTDADLERMFREGDELMARASARLAGEDYQP